MKFTIGLVNLCWISRWNHSLFKAKFARKKSIQFKIDSQFKWETGKKKNCHAHNLHDSIFFHSLHSEKKITAFFGKILFSLLTLSNSNKMTINHFRNIYIYSRLDLTFTHMSCTNICIHFKIYQISLSNVCTFSWFPHFKECYFNDKNFQQSCFFIEMKDAQTHWFNLKSMPSLDVLYYKFWNSIVYVIQ